MSYEKMRAALIESKRLLRLFQENYGTGFSQAEIDDINIACSQAEVALNSEPEDEPVTQVITESVIRHDQPYEITTDIGVKYSAKGECQPEAGVKISRKLENGNEIGELIRADWTRGVEEVMAAIDEIKKRNAGAK